MQLKPLMSTVLGTQEIFNKRHFFYFIIKYTEEGATKQVYWCSIECDVVPLVGVQWDQLLLCLLTPYVFAWMVFLPSCSQILEAIGKTKMKPVAYVVKD